MRFRIGKRWWFEAGHHLDMDFLPDDHPCRRPHGHSYEVEVVLEWQDHILVKDEPGWITDFGRLAAVGRLVARLDHQNLNEVFRELGYPDLPTTSECLAMVLLNELEKTDEEWVGKYLAGVRVRETRTTWAEVWRD